MMSAVVSTSRDAATGQTSPASEQISSPRLGYLLKHAQLRYAEMTSAAFAPLGIRPHEWAALNCLDEQHELSQKEVAELLGIDRTTMVALVDELQGKGLVQRRPQPEDRRKNVVTLTIEGRTMLRRGALLADDCERRFLAVLDHPDAEHLKQALQVVVAANRTH
jgi:DNA-binding MarR family transcriptional regulator